MPEPARRIEPIAEPLTAPPPGWIPAKEAAVVCGVTQQTVRNWIAADRIAGRMCSAPGGAAWYLDPFSHDRLAAYYAPTEEGLATGMRLAELSARQRIQAAGRMETVLDWRRFRALLSKDTPVTEAFGAWAAAHAVRTGRKKPVSWTSMWRWVKALEDGEGIVELAPKRTGRRPTEPGVEAWAFFQTLYLTTARRKIHDCWGQTAAAARKHNWDWPNYQAIRRKVLRDIPRPTAVLAREGEKPFDDKCVPFIARDYESLAPNDWWVVDHHQLDVAVIGPNGRPAFPWLTMWNDCKSRKPVGWLMHFCPNLDVVLASLRRALLINGVPKHLYFDNGKEFRAKQFTGGRPKKVKVALDEMHVRSALHHLPTEVHFARPYNPQAKPIERFFRTLRMQFSKQWRTYRGNGIETRPEGLDKLLAAYEDNGLVPKLSELAAGLNEWIEEVYCKTAHGGAGMNARTPEQVYRSELRTITRVSDDELILLMMRTTKPLTVGRNGVRLWRRDFNAPELMHRQGKKVYARYDPKLIGQIYLFDADDRLVCVAKRLDLIAWGATHDDVRDRIKAKRRFRKVAKSYAETSELLTGDPIENIALQRQHAAAIKTAGPDDPSDPDGGKTAPTVKLFRSALADTQAQLRRSAIAAGLERAGERDPMNDLPDVAEAAPAGVHAVDADDVFDALDV